MRRKARIDSNQPQIIETFRAMGASVAPTHTLGAGFPDLVVGWRGINLLVEIKDGDKPPSKRQLTEDEQRWHEDWRGNVVIVESVGDAINLLNGVGR